MNDPIDREFEQVDLSQKLSPENAAIVAAQTNFLRAFILLMSAGVLLGGIQGAFGISRATAPTSFIYLEMIAINAISYFWLIKDARIINYNLTWAMKFSVVALGGLALLYYFLRTRGVIGCFKSFWFVVLLSIPYGIVKVFTGAIVKTAMGGYGVGPS